VGAGSCQPGAFLRLPFARPVAPWEVAGRGAGSVPTGEMSPAPGGGGSRPFGFACGRQRRSQPRQRGCVGPSSGADGEEGGGEVTSLPPLSPRQLRARLCRPSLAPRCCCCCAWVAPWLRAGRRARGMPTGRWLQPPAPGSGAGAGSCGRGRCCRGDAAAGVCSSPSSPQCPARAGARSGHPILDCFSSAVLQLKVKLLPQRKS